MTAYEPSRRNKRRGIQFINRIFTALLLAGVLNLQGFTIAQNQDLATSKSAQPNSSPQTYAALQADMLTTFDNSSLMFESPFSRDGQSLTVESSMDFGENDRHAASETTLEEPSENLMTIKPEYSWELFEITYYTKNEKGMDGRGITKSGTLVESGRTIAVDPDVIPYGTRVYIEGVGYRIAEDTGSAIRGNRIDVYVDSHTEFPAIGRFETRVRMIEPD